MKAIMISIKPQHLVNILNGKKPIEVRKNKALANATKKMIAEQGYAQFLVYCSKDKGNNLHKNRNGWFVNEMNVIFVDGKPIYENYNGKVVCSFKCYKVEDIKPKVKLGILNTYNTYETETLVINPLLEKCCLSYEELDLYLEWKNGYAIHISDLKIFDTPKELGEFKHERKFENTPITEITRLTKAPQNYCYVEVEE